MNDPIDEFDFENETTNNNSIDDEFEPEVISDDAETKDSDEKVDENERLTPSPTMDDDSQFYEGNGEGGDASNQYSVPLIPTEFTSIDEAMQNFTVVFESRYFPYRLKMNENLYTNKLSLVLCTS